jgi:probable HAF family extracellular repeat protein
MRRRFDPDPIQKVQSKRRKNLNRMMRNICWTSGKALVLCAFVSLLVIPAVVFAAQESGGAEQRKRDSNSLTFTQIDVPGAMFTAAFGINDRGQIVGVFADAGGVVHGFLSDNGNFTQIDVPQINFPDAPGTQAFGIRERGQIVGGFPDARGALHGFLSDQGLFTQIDFPGATETLLVGINNRGQIVGAFSTRDQIVGRFNDLNNAAGSHGFLLDDGAFTPIDFPGALGTVAFGINDRGHIVGSFVDNRGAVHGFLLDDGVFTHIDVPGATLSTGNGITNRGQIVGTFVDTSDVAHGYLLDNGRFTTIAPPGAMTTEAVGINDRGQIVGVFIDAAGVAHGFCAVFNKGFGRSGKNPSQAQRTCNGDAQGE